MLFLLIMSDSVTSICAMMVYAVLAERILNGRHQDMEGCHKWYR